MTETTKQKKTVYPAVEMLRMNPRRKRTIFAWPSDAPEETPDKTKVWLDCDPGHDDAMAIILAGFHPYIELLGISTVGSNQTVEQTTLNACRVVAATGINVRVFSGQEKPLCRPARHDPEIHGETGLDGSDLLNDIKPSEDIRGATKGVIAMAQTILHEREKVWIVATGCLTNVALAVTLYPEMIQYLHGICVMGGCLGIGNRGPVQEYNILCDPEAAQIVFGLGKPPTELKIVMVPLEVTHTAIATKAVISTISNLNPHSFIPRMCANLLQSFASTNHRVFGFSKGPPLHDPCAVAFIIDPSMFHVDHMNVEIETSSALTAGQTICDVWGTSGQPKSVYVCRSMNVSKFWTFMTDAIFAASSLNVGRAPASSPRGRTPPNTAPGKDGALAPNACVPSKQLLTVRKMLKTKKNAQPKKKASHALDAGAPDAAVAIKAVPLTKPQDATKSPSTLTKKNPTISLPYTLRSLRSNTHLEMVRVLPRPSPGRKKKQANTNATTTATANETANVATNVTTNETANVTTDATPDEPSDTKEAPAEDKEMEKEVQLTAATQDDKMEEDLITAATRQISRKRRAEPSEGDSKSEKSAKVE
eukprot:GEMP01030407.1.p1 GENE.GEMP01030407.1~~GEMP01030407.1.p1  ORF type:complete len:592 (-),score=128.39 GEMP01030407.1:276-2051(-)